MKNRYKNIEEYGLIGNLDTCALVSNDALIDWLPVLHIESPSIFCSVLDTDKGGSFSVQPADQFISEQRYIEHTNVLQTHFTTTYGKLSVTDFMPPLYDEGMNNSKRWVLFRKIKCEEGEVETVISFKPRYYYARVTPLIEDHAIGLKVIDGEMNIYLQTDIDFEIESGSARAHRTFKKGDEQWLLLMWEDDSYIPFIECENIMVDTIQYWRNESHVCAADPCVFEGPWHDLVIRSGLTLKLLTHPSTGAVSIQEQDRLQVASGVDWCDNPGKRSSNILFQISHARLLRYLHFISAGWISFARGVSDAPKITALFLIAGSTGVGIVVGLVTISMALGGLLFAKRVTRTMAFDITGMNESEGFFANVQTGFLVLSASVLGLPVSTTQLACSSLIGLGVLRGDARWRQIRSIGLARLLTLPFAAVFAGIIAFVIDSMNIF